MPFALQQRLQLWQWTMMDFCSCLRGGWSFTLCARMTEWTARQLSQTKQLWRSCCVSSWRTFFVKPISLNMISINHVLHCYSLPSACSAACDCNDSLKLKRRKEILMLHPVGFRSFRFLREFEAVSFFRVMNYCCCFTGCTKMIWFLSEDYVRKMRHHPSSVVGQNLPKLFKI